MVGCLAWPGRVEALRMGPHRRVLGIKGHGATSRPHAILIFKRPDAAPRRIFHEPSALRCGHRGTFTHGANGGRCARARVGRYATCSPLPLMVATGQRPLGERDTMSMKEVEEAGIVSVKRVDLLVNESPKINPLAQAPPWPAGGGRSRRGWTQHGRNLSSIPVVTVPAFIRTVERPLDGRIQSRITGRIS